jgi:M42 glutamyl aminopeptidase
MRIHPLRVTTALPLALLALGLMPLSSTAQKAPDRTLTLLQRLSDAPGPPGAEDPVRAIMVAEMKPFAASIQYDGMGSVIAQQGTIGPRIMIDAHMDELGGMVRRIAPDGLITMQMLGGWLDQALVDQRWIVLGSKGPVHAVTGIRDIHVVPADERTHVYPRDAMYLDIGAKNKEEAAALGIEPGDPVVPDSPFVVLNGTDNYLGKAGMTASAAPSYSRPCAAPPRCPTPTSSSSSPPRRRRSVCAAPAPRPRW